MDIVQELSRIVPPGKPIVFLCVGTDRSTGDSYGPLVGTALKQMQLGVRVFGSLTDPVHALNVAETYEQIRQLYPDDFVIAIDACLGRLDHVGQIHIEDKPLRPGAGVNKQLPEVGDACISAVVNVNGFMEYFVLQNTRLSLVMDLVDTTVSQIACFIESRNGQAVFKSRIGQVVRRMRGAMLVGES